MLLVRHGSVSVLKAGTDFRFALVQHVPVVEGEHGARGWDDELGFVAGWMGPQWMYLRMGHCLRERLNDLVWHLVGQASRPWAWGLIGPDLWVGNVRYLAWERMMKRCCCVRSVLEGTELALEWTWRTTVHTLAGLVQVPVARDAWWS